MSEQTMVSGTVGEIVFYAKVKESEHERLLAIEQAAREVVSCCTDDSGQAYVELAGFDDALPELIAKLCTALGEGRKG